jgi:hypothetical protein
LINTGIFEQQSRTAGFHAAVGKLGDFEIRVDFKRDALELAGLL